VWVSVVMEPLQAATVEPSLMIAALAANAAASQ
jgi:hypothetical protein